MSSGSIRSTEGCLRAAGRGKDVLRAVQQRFKCCSHVAASILSTGDGCWRKVGQIQEFREQGEGYITLALADGFYCLHSTVSCCSASACVLKATLPMTIQVFSAGFSATTLHFFVPES